jgi:hypothetical protein
MLDIMLAAIAAVMPQASTSWQVIDINSETMRVLTVDTATKPATPNPNAIVKARIFVTVEMPNISALVGYWTIDCRQKKHRVSDSATFDKAGKLDAPDPVPLDWEATPPNSLFEAVADYVCRGTLKHPGVVLRGSAPIAEANALLKQDI